MLSVLEPLLQLAASSYGPAGRAKLIRPDTAGECSSVTVTSISHRLFGALLVEDAVARVLLQLVAARQTRGADGGLLTLQLAALLVLGARRQRLPARLCAALLPEAFEACVRVVLWGDKGKAHGRADAGPSSSGWRMPPASLPLRMSDLACLLALVQGVLAPKHVALPGGDTESIRQLALLIVKAFVESLPDADESLTGHADEVAQAHGQSAVEVRAAAVLPGVRPLAVIGPRTEASQVLHGVLLDTPWPAGAALPRGDGAVTRDLSIALYDVCLEASMPTGLDATVRFTVLQDDAPGDDARAAPPGVPPEAPAVAVGHKCSDAPRHGAPLDVAPVTSAGGGGPAVSATSQAAAEALLARFADGVAAAGAHVLASQQRIAPALTRLLLARGVLPLPRLSLRHIGAVRRLSGAIPLSHLSAPRVGDLGRLGGVRELWLADRSYLHLLPPARSQPPMAAKPPRPPQPVVTLVLCAPNRAASEELSAVVSCALATVGTALSQRRPRVVPGAGCVELLLAAQLRRQATPTPPMPLCESCAGPDAAPDAADTATSAAASDSSSSPANLDRLRRQACTVLADSLEAVVAALAGGNQAGRQAVDTLLHANGVAAGATVGHATAGAASDTASGTSGGVAGARGDDLGEKASGGPGATGQPLRSNISENAEDEGPRHSFYGWDVERDQAMEVLRSCQEADELASESDTDSEVSSEGTSPGEDTEHPEQGRMRGRSQRHRRDQARRAATSAPCVEWAGLVELESEKLEAIGSAIEVACAIVAVDGVLIDQR